MDNGSLKVEDKIEKSRCRAQNYDMFNCCVQCRFGHDRETASVAEALDLIHIIEFLTLRRIRRYKNV